MNCVSQFTELPNVQRTLIARMSRSTSIVLFLIMHHIQADATCHQFRSTESVQLRVPQWILSTIYMACRVRRPHTRWQRWRLCGRFIPVHCIAVYRTRAFGHSLLTESIINQPCIEYMQMPQMHVAHNRLRCSKCANEWECSTQSWWKVLSSE